MINFKLKHIDESQPVGADGDLSMSWFWLTDGDLWLDLGDSTLYEYTPEAQLSFGDKETPYNGYPIIRFIADFTELFKEISESIPNDIYLLTENLSDFLNDAQKWLDLNDPDEDNYSDIYFKEYDQLISWTYKRTFDSGHLIGGPKFSFFRNKDKIRIVWETEFKLENGITIWTAKNGNVEIPYKDWIIMVKDFGQRFFDQMRKQVELAVQKDWKNIHIDKNRLVKEHIERESDFWRQTYFLENGLSTDTNWEQVRELKSRMGTEIKTKA